MKTLKRMIRDFFNDLFESLEDEHIDWKQIEKDDHNSL